MAIDKKLIHFKQWSTFISSQGVNGNYTTPSSGTAGSGSALYGQIKETSIVFIQDVQRIWTHGKLYECSAPDLSKYLTAEDLSDLNSFVEKCSVTKTGNGNGETLTVTVGDSSNSITNTWRTVQVNGSSISNNTLNLKAGTNITLSKSNGTVTITGASFPTSLPANGGTADKADVLTTARTIDGVDFNGSANITHYGTCSTSAGTAAKTVSLTGYKLATGAKVAVKFTVTNTAANPTLNVNSTGAKAIYYRGAAISKGYLAANRVYEFVYDGTNYELIGDINTDTDTNTAHSHSVGTGLSASGSGGTSGTTTYSLKTAAIDEIGGIKVASVGTAASGANTTVNANKFAVHVDSNGLGYVAIPQYSNNSGDITGVTAGKGLTGGATSGAATLNVGAGTGITVADDSVSVNLNSTTSLGTIGTTNKLYAVGVDANGKLAVNVPWTDTDTDTKVTSVGNHYTPAENTSAAISASGGSNANITGTTGKLNVITGLKRDAKGHIVGVTSANIYSTDNNDNTAHAHTAGTGLAISGSGGTSGTTTYSANLKDATALTIDATAATTTSGRVYPVAVDKSGYLAVNVPWKNDDTKSFTITASASDDDVVVLSGTNGTNKVTYSASHAKKLGDGKSYTSGNTTTSISGSGSTGTIKIPQITVDSYGHVTAAADESITITMPTIPSLSGGAAAESGKYVSGVTVSGHAVTVTKGTLPTIPTALKNPNALTFGSKSYDGSSAQSITAADLGLGTALKFHGTSKTAITDGSKTQTVTLSDNSSHTAENGCVLFYGNKEFVWNGSSWEELGNEGNYKVKQTAVSSPTASGNATSFIDTISQNENGVISATKKYITNNVTYTGTLVDEQVAVFEGTSGQIKASGYTIAKSVPSDAKFTDTDTHWTTRLYAGASGTAANAVASNPYLKVTDNDTYRNQVRLVGSGTVSVASDASGNITISGTAHPTSLPASDVYSWAKAAKKPSYKTSEVAEETNLYFTNTRAINACSGTYLPLTGGIITGGTITIGSAGLPLLNNNQIPTNQMAIGRNGIAISCTDTRNDAAAIFVENIGSESNRLVIAMGDDATSAQDYVVFRQYTTSGTVGHEVVVPRTSGTLALTSQIPTTLPASDVYAWAKKSALALSDVPDLSTKYLSLSGGTITSSSQYALQINSSYANPWSTFIQMLNSKMSTTNHTCNIAFGYKASAKNLGYIGFKYKGTDSTSNMLTMGLHSVDNVINVLGTGNVGIGTESPAAKLDVVGDIKTSGSVKIQSASITYDSTQKCIKFTF